MFKFERIKCFIKYWRIIYTIDNKVSGVYVCERQLTAKFCILIRVYNF